MVDRYPVTFLDNSFYIFCHQSRVLKTLKLIFSAIANESLYSLKKTYFCVCGIEIRICRNKPVLFSDSELPSLHGTCTCICCFQTCVTSEADALSHRYTDHMESIPCQTGLYQKTQGCQNHPGKLMVDWWSLTNVKLLFLYIQIFSLEIKLRAPPF